MRSRREVLAVLGRRRGAFDGPFEVPAGVRLAAGSPRIDAGDPDPTYDDPDGTRNDMGAYGGPDSPSPPTPAGPPTHV